MMKIVGFGKSETHLCTRYRLSALRPFFEESQISFTVKKWPRSTVSQFLMQRSIGTFDLAILQRRMPSAFQLNLLRRSARLIAFDFDDAIFINDSNDPRGHINPKRQELFNKICSRVDIVIAGNSYLKQQVPSSIQRPAAVIPTCINLEEYPRKAWKLDGSNNLTLVWIGSRSTLPGLMPMMELFDDISADIESGLELRIICDCEMPVANISTRFVRWSKSSEVEDIQAGDVGIAWMPDDPWSRGKCGLKVLQYMAAGIPVIANPVGIHNELVLHGHNGFLVSSRTELMDALKFFMEYPRQRIEFGSNARATVEEKYSVEVAAKKWLEIIELHTVQ